MSINSARRSLKTSNAKAKGRVGESGEQWWYKRGIQGSLDMWVGFPGDCYWQELPGSRGRF